MIEPKKVTIGPCELWLGDCREILPNLVGVDAVITDPPYAANTHKQAKTNRGAGHGVSLITFEALDNEGFESVIGLCLQASAGWVVATCDYKHAALLFTHEKFIRLGAWVKPNPMPQISADRPGQGFEAVAILHSGKTSKRWNRGGGSGVWTFSPHSGSEVPTQKPLALASSFVRDFTQVGEVVADPFMGSGTTGVACVENGRRFIGIEVDPRHFEISVKRIAHAVEQSKQRLFEPEPEPQPDQPGLGLDASA